MFHAPFYKNVTAALFGLLLVPGMIGCAETDAQEGDLSTSAALTQEQEALIASQCEPILDDLAMVGQDQVAAQGLYDAYDACVRQISEPAPGMTPDEPSTDDPHSDPEAIALCEPIFMQLDTPGLSSDEIHDIFSDYETCIESFVSEDMTPDQGDTMNPGDTMDQQDMNQGGDQTDPLEACQDILEVLQDPSFPPEQIEAVLDDYDLCVGPQDDQGDTMNPDDTMDQGSMDQGDGSQQDDVDPCQGILDVLQDPNLPQEEFEAVLDDYDQCVGPHDDQGDAMAQQPNMNQDDAMEQSGDEACDAILELLQYTQDQAEIEALSNDYDACIGNP